MKSFRISSLLAEKRKVKKKLREKNERLREVRKEIKQTKQEILDIEYDKRKLEELRNNSPVTASQAEEMRDMANSVLEDIRSQMTKPPESTGLIDGQGKLRKAMIEEIKLRRSKTFKPLPGEEVCDFCNDKNPKWQIECGHIESLDKTWCSDDFWAACETCKLLIEQGRWEGLIQRAYAPHIDEANLRFVHKQFREKMGRILPWNK